MCRPGDRGIAQRQENDTVYGVQVGGFIMRSSCKVIKIRRSREIEDAKSRVPDSRMPQNKQQ